MQVLRHVLGAIATGFVDPFKDAWSLFFSQEQTTYEQIKQFINMSYKMQIFIFNLWIIIPLLPIIPPLSKYFCV